MTTNLIATQTVVPDSFGQGGANLSPGGASGTPDLKTLLQEIQTALAAVDGQVIQKRTVTVTEALLTAAVNGTAQALNIGAVLPANARIKGIDLRAYTPFTGGGASAVTLDIGTSGDVDAIVAAADVFAAAVDGGPATIPKGVRPGKMFATAGAQLIATFTPDGGHQLVNLTAGAVTIDILFIVLA